MSRNFLRIIACGALFLVMLILEAFTSLDHEVKLSIAIIFVFLILFTYIFSTGNHPTLNVAVIIAAFIGLPVFLVMYLNIPDSLPGIWGGILAAVTVIIFGLLSIWTIMKLNFVEIDFVE